MLTKLSQGYYTIDNIPECNESANYSKASNTNVTNKDASIQCYLM